MWRDFIDILQRTEENLQKDGSLIKSELVGYLSSDDHTASSISFHWLSHCIVIDDGIEIESEKLPFRSPLCNSIYFSLSFTGPIVKRREPPTSRLRR